MNRSSLAFLFFSLSSGQACAVCDEVSVRDEVKSSDNVFVATLTGAQLASPAGELRDRQTFRIIYAFVVREGLKGDPTKTKTIYTTNHYDDPTDDRTTHWAEQTRLVPGESVLVITHGSDDAEVSLCSPSRQLSEYPEALTEARLALAL